MPFTAKKNIEVKWFGISHGHAVSSISLMNLINYCLLSISFSEPMDADGDWLDQAIALGREGEEEERRGRRREEEWRGNGRRERERGRRNESVGRRRATERRSQRDHERGKRE